MATLIVTTLSDSGTHDGLSLRDALAIANAHASSDIIEFGSEVSGTIVLEQGALTISSNVTINGNAGGGITISGNGSSRIFSVVAGTSTIDDLTLRDGVASSGGAILVYRGANLTVDRSTITSNHTVAAQGDSSRGGGISNLGTLTVKNSTIENNSAYDHGGGIYNGGTLTAVNSTISDNSTAGFGGGVLSDGGHFDATNITVCGNSASTGGGIVNEVSFDAKNITVCGNYGGSYGAGVFNAGSFALSNSIILGNGPGGPEGEVFGHPSTSGVNILGVGSDRNASDGIINVSSVESVFGGNGLASNGGPVRTIMLASDANPAVDTAFGPYVPDLDARGVLRVGLADLGAIEREAGSTVPPDPTPDPTPVPTPDPTPDPVPEPTPVPVPEVPNVIKGSVRADSLQGLTGRDVIYAYSGNDIVHGDDGGDRLLGGLGNDRLYGDSGNDSLYGSQGSDRVYGGLGNDRLFGQDGNDRLIGGWGNDTLTGGFGHDRFYFDNLFSKDTVTDFDAFDDTIMLSHNAFAGLDIGSLAGGALQTGTEAIEEDDRIIYDADTGDISFDADGAGGGDAVTFAKISAGLFLTADDFFVY
jgi:Ca2+-binding RTX toxin-like protein